MNQPAGFDPERFFELVRTVGHGRALALEYRQSADNWIELALPWREELVGIPEQGILSNLRIENFSQWVLTAINSPVQRAIGFGLGLGALAMSLRIWLSLERGTYFAQEE